MTVSSLATLMVEVPRFRRPILEAQRIRRAPSLSFQLRTRRTTSSRELVEVTPTVTATLTVLPLMENHRASALALLIIVPNKVTGKLIQDF